MFAWFRRSLRSMTNPAKRDYYKQNQLKQLRAFCHAAETQSVSRAAQRMFLSQPSVSLLIQALEKNLQTVLFDRSGPRISITAEGKILHALALPLVEGIEALPDVFQEHTRDLIAGELDIAAGESTILYLLPGIVKHFTRKHPDIRFKLHNVTGHSGLAMVRANEVDLAVGSMLEVPDDIGYQPVFSYDPVLITSLDHPLAGRKQIKLADISPYGLILPPRHLSTWRIVDLVFSQHDVPYQVAMEVGGWEVIKEYVQCGLGISIVTNICLRGNEKLSVIPLHKYFPRRSYGVVTRKAKHLSPAARRFIEMMMLEPARVQHHEASASQTL